MSFQPGAVLYTQSFGSRPENIEVPHIDSRAPSSTDVLYPVGKWWLYTGNSLWYLLSQSSAGGTLSSNWIQVAGSSGDILSILGTTNQITVTTSAGVATLSIPTTFIAPGSIAATTTVTGGTGVVATTGNLTASAAASGLVLTPTVASGAQSGTVAANGRVVSVTFTGISIAGGATLALTTSNTSITGSGTLILPTLIGATTGSGLTIQSTAQTAGQSVITVTNATGATTTTANITINYLVLN